MMTKRKAAAILLGVGLGMGALGWRTDPTNAFPPESPAPRASGAGTAPAQDEGELHAATFKQLFQQIRPQPGESRWLEIPWLIDVHEARQKAAAEGKPIFVLSGGGATGIGPC